MTDESPIFEAKKAWLATSTVIIAGIFAAMVMYRQMSVVPLLMEYFGVSVGTYGNVSAIVGLFTIVGALVSGPFQAKFGPRRTMIVCLILFTLTMSFQLLVAYLAPNFILFMAFGVFGYMAYGAWMVVPPVIIAAWFPSEKRGLPNSISTAWISFAMLILLTVSNPLVALAADESFAWINIWWMILILLLIGLVLVLLFGKMPSAEHNFMEKIPEGASKAKMRDSLKNSGVWMLILMFLSFGFTTAAYGNYFPTYLSASVDQGGFGIELSDANSLSSISTYIMVVVGFLWGFVLNKVPNKRYNTLILVVMVLTVINGVAMFALPSASLLIPYLIYYGIVSRVFPPVCFVIVPEISETQEEISLSIGILSVFTNLMNSVANGLCGTLVDVTGTWNSIVIPSSIFGLIAIVAAVGLFSIYKRRAKDHQGLSI